jgi:hypothetical protein
LQEEIYFFLTGSSLALRPIQSYPKDTGFHFPGVMEPGHEAYNWPRSSAEIKNAWNCASVCSYVFMAWGLFKNRINFTALICVLQTSFVKFSLRMLSSFRSFLTILHWSKNSVFDTEVKQYLAQRNKKVYILLGLQF